VFDSNADTTSTGATPFKVVRGYKRYDGDAISTTRPAFNSRTDDNSLTTVEEGFKF